MHKNVFKESNTSVKKAVKYLERSKLVALKTETVYGLACDPSNIEAINKLYELKKRPAFNPLIIHVNSLDLAKKISFVNRKAEEIMKKFWPGPLTLVLPRKKNNFVHDFAVSGLETIAIRFPNSEIINKIISAFKRPIAAPSANTSGYISSTDAHHVIECFGNKVDLVINSGRSNYGIESTILDLTGPTPLIQRLGVIDSSLLKERLGVEILESHIKDNKRPNSPGQCLKHYSPKTPLKVNVNKPKIGDAFLNFGNDNSITHDPSLNLSKSSNLNEAAYNLFDFLRKLDKLRKKRIVVAPIPYIGIGKTINERLEKASI